MKTIAAPIRVAPAFSNREEIHELFLRNGPYQAAAAYLPDGSDESIESIPIDAVLPWFRATWALGGTPRIQAVEAVLWNERFIHAARTLFNGARIVPRTVVVNVNAPMPAGVPHIDVPSFCGATRETLPLRLLIAMGASELFEPWRVVEAGAISWFYGGPGGGFDYWPEGAHGPMVTEHPPFSNVAIVADNDRMYHRIGRIGRPDDPLPRMTAAAQIAYTGGVWSITDNGEVRGQYDRDRVRLSVLWKAEAVFADYRSAKTGALSTERIAEIFQRDLQIREPDLDMPPNPFCDDAWIASISKIYTAASRASAPRVG
jgi:hypothetical protein